MFTQSCSEVKPASIAVQRISLDVAVSKWRGAASARAEKKVVNAMLKNVLWSWGSSAHNENAPESKPVTHGVNTASNVRALATGAALAVSLDTSPAVLVSIYDYAHRYRDKGRRCA